MLPWVLLLVGSLGLGFFVSLGWHWAIRIPLFRTELTSIRNKLDCSMVTRGTQNDPDYLLLRGAINWVIAQALICHCL